MVELRRLKHFYNIALFVKKFGVQETSEMLVNFSHDPLTGLQDRRALKNHPEDNFSVVFIDIDNFKKVNDTKGYEEGDRVLKNFVEVLKKHSREGDVLVRWGGDEFLIIVPRTRAWSAIKIIKRIKESSLRLNPPVKFSFGIVEKQDNEDIFLLAQRASKVMQKMKGRKKGDR